LNPLEIIPAWRAVRKFSRPKSTAIDCKAWARDELACAREFDLTILGGCAERNIEALAKEAEA
jgi:hypothetical protein